MVFFGIKDLIHLKFILFIVICFNANDGIFAQTISVQDGPWSDPQTWNSGVPGNSSNVVINHHVNIDANDRCRSVSISNSGVLSNDGFTLRVDRNWENNGVFIDTLGTINFNNSFFGVLFGGQYSITGNTDFNNLNINLNTINLNSGITIRGVLNFGLLATINVNTGSLKLIASDTYHGRIGTNGAASSINGTITSERYVGRCNEWSWYAGPFDATLNQFASSSGGRMVYTGFPGSSIPSFSFVNTYFYNEDWNNVGFTGYVVPSSANDLVSRGTGFWYWNSDTVFSSGQSSIPQTWKMSLSGDISLGTRFNFNLNYTDNGNSAYDGWNFLGNPFPGTMNWDDDSWNSSGLDGALYAFNTCTQAYTSYAGGVGTNGGTNIIPSYQGFHVKAVSAGPTLSVTSGALIDQDASLKSTNLLENILRIHLDEDEIVIRANDNATEDFDVGMDALKFSADYERVYTKNYGLDQNYSINSVNDSTAHIPLFTKGSGTLFFTDVESWESRYNLTLEDLQTGQMFEIHPGFGIQFSSLDTVNFENRFVVHLFGGSDLGINEFENDIIEILYDHDFLVLRSDYIHKPVQVDMINMLGQVVFSEKIQLNSEGVRIRRPNQIMILRITDQKVLKTQKVF